MNPNREERRPAESPPLVTTTTAMQQQQQQHQQRQEQHVTGGHIAVQAIDNDNMSWNVPASSTTSGVHYLNSWQKLSRETASAPLLARPTAPFARTEQKRALTSAMYYSECFLNGIEPKVADATAGEMQERYTKWWIGSKPSPIRSSDPTALDNKPVLPKRKRTLNEIDVEAASDEGRFCVNEQVTAAGMTLAAAALAYVTSEDESTRGATAYNNDDSRHNSRQLKYPRLTATGDVYLSSSSSQRDRMEGIKRELIYDLRTTGGDTGTPTFLTSLHALTTFYESCRWDVRDNHNKNPSLLDINGTWLSLTKPTYSDCKGRNAKGDFVYALGRMSFDMFRPTHLNCSIQGVYNRIGPVAKENFSKRPFFVPRRLRHEVSGRGAPALRNYDVIVAFTIEANQTRRGTSSQAGTGRKDEYKVAKPIRGILTNYGYVIPDPEVPNRLSIWFSGGTLQVQDENQDAEVWKQIFDVGAAPQRDMMEMARVLGARILLGANLPDKMEDDGSMSYSLKRPIGGHGSAFCDVLYMDDTLRIMRGHHGSIFVSTRFNPTPIADDEVMSTKQMNID